MTNLTQNQLQKLYESDDYLWLQEIIKLLKIKDLDNLDLDNLIEELESVGRNDLNKVRSLLRQIMIHLLLLQYWEQEYDRNYRHWRGEIIAFRDDINNNLTTTLKNKLSEELEHIYNVSMKLVIEKTGISPNLLPDNCPYSLEQLLDDHWYPQK